MFVVIYKTVATYNNREPEVKEIATTMEKAQAWLVEACLIFRSLPGYKVHRTQDNRSAVIKTEGYSLEITVEKR